MTAAGEGIVLSFHPTLAGDRFLWEQASLGTEEIDLIRQARAVLLPQTVSRQLYFLVRHNCPAVFPDYDLRFQWEGKVGDAMLFQTFAAPHPPTRVYPRVEALEQDHPLVGYTRSPLVFPCVVKANRGGEGRYTWLVHDHADLEHVVRRLKALELKGWFGFIIQEYVAGVERDLRVVVMGERLLSYWRINPGFHKNVARGGTIDPGQEPELQARGRREVASLCRRTGINLAGFDLIFPRGSRRPLFLEINYTFGRRGLGGTQGFQDMLQEEVRRWLDRQKIPRDA
ncbi:MAG TPA: glutathione synthase [Desulfobulbus sp.]|nr:glutathione synthase [Desulfobulbus sp.]